MSYKAALFDMDGTILNTLDDLADAVNFALQKNNLPVHTIEEIKYFVGNGIKKLIERAIPEKSTQEVFEKVYSDFTDYYKVHCADKTSPYAGIKEAILSLKKQGIKTAVVSNKADYGVQELVQVHFEGLFDVAIGVSEGLRTKPSPDMVNKALKTLNADSKDSVYIGDSDVDMATATNSNLDFIGVEWGFRGRKFLESLGAKTIVDKAEELIPLITK